MKINILLSTFNGEKFLSEQIESIINQTYEDWTLLIRDDGSTDGTVGLIHNYCLKDERIQLIDAQEGVNLGFVASFFELLKYEKADFYFFCDQDDIWLPYKVKLMITEASKYDNKSAMMYYTDLKVVDSELHTLSESLNQDLKGGSKVNLNSELVKNVVTGCASMINDELANLWLSPKKISYHDYFLALAALAVGDLVFINERTVFYRQHSSNVIGRVKSPSDIKRKGFMVRFNNRSMEYWDLIITNQLMAKELLNLPNLSLKNKKRIENFVYLGTYSLIKRVVIVCSSGYRRGMIAQTLMLNFLLATNCRRSRYIKNARDKIFS